MGHLFELVNQYGYLILFVSLMLELIALPVPTEILMSYIGYLTYKGELNLYVSTLLGFLGACLGMTIAYGIGYKLGFPFFKKYGHFVHMGNERLEKTSRLFSKYGVILLLISCFIPGVRHITGYLSGITHSPYRRFAPFAYAGAFIWVATFIGLGRALGQKYTMIEEPIKHYLAIIVVVIAVVVAVYLLIKLNRKKSNAGERHPSKK